MPGVGVSHTLLDWDRYVGRANLRFERLGELSRNLPSVRLGGKFLDSQAADEFNTGSCFTRVNA